MKETIGSHPKTDIPSINSESVVEKIEATGRFITANRSTRVLLGVASASKKLFVLMLTPVRTQTNSKHLNDISHGKDFEALLVDLKTLEQQPGRYMQTNIANDRRICYFCNME